MQLVLCFNFNVLHINLLHIFGLNVGLYPICVAVVDAENGENWLWFMQRLREFLNFERPVVFVSDRHEGRDNRRNDHSGRRYSEHF